MNLILNTLLIPKLQSIGAAIGTVAAEFTVMFYQAFAIRKELQVKKYAASSIEFLLKSAIMFVAVYYIGTLKLEVLIKIAIKVFTGIAIYSLINWQYIRTNIIKRGKN